MTWFLCTTKIVRQLLLKVREGFRGFKVVLDEYGMRRGKRADKPSGLGLCHVMSS